MVGDRAVGSVVGEGLVDGNGGVGDGVDGGIVTGGIVGGANIAGGGNGSGMCISEYDNEKQ